MGEVYDALDEVIDRPVALKVASKRRGAGLGAGARKEARTLARLDHPNIVRFYEAGLTDDGEIYIAMERIHGISLRMLLHRMGALDMPSALSMTLQIVDALWVAHEVGVIHRDLKPENVLVMQSGHAKVVDFGVARWLDASDSSDVFADVGTVHYMAPEQVLGQGAVRGSDIYAIGVMLHEMLRGRFPFAQATGEMPTRQEVAQHHVHAAAPPLLEVVPGFDSPTVSAMVQKMMAKSPVDRPSAEVVHEVLLAEYRRCREELLSGQGRLARQTAPEEWGGRKSKLPSPIPPSAAPRSEGGGGGRGRGMMVGETAPLGEGFRPARAALPFREGDAGVGAGAGTGAGAGAAAGAVAGTGTGTGTGMGTGAGAGTGTGTDAGAGTDAAEMPRRWPRTERMLPHPVTSPWPGPMIKPQAVSHETAPPIQEASDGKSGRSAKTQHATSPRRERSTALVVILSALGGAVLVGSGGLGVFIVMRSSEPARAPVAAEETGAVTVPGAASASASAPAAASASASAPGSASASAPATATPRVPAPTSPRPKAPPVATGGKDPGLPLNDPWANRPKKPPSSPSPTSTSTPTPTKRPPNRPF